MVFWSMSLLIIVLITSGVVIWDQYFAEYFTITQKRVAILIHAIAAIAAICVWIVHVYAAIWVRGTISAMTRGRVTGGWAWRHHRKWLKDLVTTKS
jgi:formate dehydrogenase subunit gamma